MKVISALRRMVHNVDRITHRLGEIEGHQRAIIEGMDNQSRLFDRRSQELIALMEKLESHQTAIIEGMENQSRLFDGRSQELINCMNSQSIVQSFSDLLADQKVMFDLIRFQLLRIADLLRANIPRSPDVSPKKTSQSA